MEVKKDVHVIVTNNQHTKLKNLIKDIKRETTLSLSFSSIIGMVLDCMDKNKFNKKIEALKNIVETQEPDAIHITHCDTLIAVEDGEDRIHCPICGDELNVNEMVFKL